MTHDPISTSIPVGIPVGGPERLLRRTHLLGPITISLLLLSGCGGDDASPRADRGPAVTPAVEALQARSGGLPLEAELNGVVKARNQVAIRPQVEAAVTAVLVRSGEAVRAGQPLVQLDDEGLGEQLSQARANARRAEATAAEARAQVAEIEARISRTRALHQEGVVSDMTLDTQEAQLQAARARADQAAAQVEEAHSTVEERRSEMAKSTIRAPISGRVGRRDVEVGMLVNPSTTLFMVGDFDELIVEVSLTEKQLGRVTEGTPVLVQSDALGAEPIEAVMSRISPFLEQNSFSTTGEIDIENPDPRLRPGMFVTVNALYGQSESATLVPASAIWEDPATGDLGIYVMQDPPTRLSEAVMSGGEISDESYIFELREVDLIAEGEASVGVSGVEPGEWVVTVGQQLLHEASRPGRGGDRRGGPPDRGDTVAGGPTGPPTARVRVAEWDDVLALQRLQREDLLAGFLEKQRAVARAIGSDIPADPGLVDRILAEQNAQGGAAQEIDGAPSSPAATRGD